MRSAAIKLPRPSRFVVLALLQLAVAALLLIQALHLNRLALDVGQPQAVPPAQVSKQAARQDLSTQAEFDAVAREFAADSLAARPPRRPPMRAPAKRTIFETVERRWKEYRLLGTQRFA